MSEEKANFTLINRLSVSIASHRNQLLKCDNVQELDLICSQIITLENELLAERKKEITVLSLQKEEILGQIVLLESKLDELNLLIQARIGRYRDAVTYRITQLEDQVSTKRGEMDLPTISD
jgi:hypothetical protein